MYTLVKMYKSGTYRNKQVCKSGKQKYIKMVKRKSRQCCARAKTARCSKMNNEHTQIFQKHYSTKDVECQVRDYAEKMLPAERVQNLISASLRKNGKKEQAINVDKCGSYLLFQQYKKENEERARLKQINLCKNKYCPFCNAVKASKNHRALKLAIASQSGLRDYQFKFFTLTVPNVNISELKATVRKMSSAWNTLNTTYKKTYNLRGYYRSLEVTYNKRERTYHPHFHVLADCDFIPQKELSEDWKRYCADFGIDFGNNSAVVNIKIAENAHELCKYIIKPDTLTSTSVNELISNNALFGLRDNASGGSIRQELKEIKTNFKSKDEEIKTEADKLSYIELAYLWFNRQYTNVGIKILK